MHQKWVPPSKDFGKTVFSLQTLKRIGGQDTKGRPIWKSKGRCHASGGQWWTEQSPGGRCTLRTSSPQCPRTTWGAEVQFWGFFYLQLQASPRSNLGTTTPTHRTPCRDCTQAVFLGTPLGQDPCSTHLFPSPQDWPHRALRACCSSSGILCTHLQERCKRTYQARKQSQCSHLRCKLEHWAGETRENGIF